MVTRKWGDPGLRNDPVAIGAVVNPFSDGEALRKSAGLAWAFATMLLFVVLALTAELAATQREMRALEESIAVLEARVSRWDVEMPAALVEVRR